MRLPELGHAAPLPVRPRLVEGLGRGRGVALQHRDGAAGPGCCGGGERPGEAPAEDEGAAGEAPAADGETTGGADSTNGADDDVVDAEIVDDDQNTGTK